MSGRKLLALCVGTMVCFAFMVALNLLRYMELHYVFEAAEFFLAGVTCGLISREDEELFAVSLVLPAAVNYLFGALFVPICAALACFYYAGLYLGGESK